MNLSNFKMPKIDIRNPRTRNAIIIIAAGIGSWVWWYYTPYTTRIEEKKALEKTKQQKQDELNKILAMKPQLTKLREEIKVSRQLLDSLRNIFPDQKEIPRLIRETTKVARAAGIETIKFTPLPDVKKEYYIENRYHMIVRGGYHQIANFFSFLANLPLIINLSEVAVKVNPGITKEIDKNKEDGTVVQSVNVSFRMTTFSSRK